MSIIKFTPNASRINNITSKKTNNVEIKPYENVSYIKNLNKQEMAQVCNLFMAENLNYLTLLTEMTLPQAERFKDSKNFDLYKNFVENKNERTANRVETLEYLFNKDLPFETRKKIFGVIEYIRGHLNLIKYAPEYLGVNINADIVVRSALIEPNFAFNENNSYRKVWQSFDNKITEHQKQLNQMQDMAR